VDQAEAVGERALTQSAAATPQERRDQARPTHLQWRCGLSAARPARSPRRAKQRLNDRGGPPKDSGNGGHPRPRSPHRNLRSPACSVALLGPRAGGRRTGTVGPSGSRSPPWRPVPGANHLAPLSRQCPSRPISGRPRHEWYPRRWPPLQASRLGRGRSAVPTPRRLVGPQAWSRSRHATG